LVGFSSSAVFSSELQLSRDPFVLVYLILVGGLLLAFGTRHAAVFRRHLRRNWPIGVLAGLLIGALLAMTIAQQPGSSVPSGLQLVRSLVWLGVVYGTLDGLLLSVLPVMVLARAETTSQGRRRLGWRVAVLGLVASAVVTAAYHLGYREFRGPQLAEPLIGNTIMTAGYVLTGNIAAPLIAHVIMHGAAVLHGMETTTQLPPHY
jgi:NADH:ubiquinone oxidoreductase subunit 6 (subunit J)